MKGKWPLILLLFTITLKAQSNSEWIQHHFDSDFYKSQFTGFYLYDPQTNAVLENVNGDKYFTPASNVKIFTLYTSLRTLPDSIPALKYSRNGNELHIQGTGDPTFLHPQFQSYQKALNFLKEEPGTIYLHWGNFEGTRLGLGWSWEDYEKYFSPERSEFPMYGNMATIKKGKSGISAFPNALADSVEVAESLYNRDFTKNRFYVGSRNGTSTKVPFVTKEELIRQLLSEAVDKEVILSDKPLNGKVETLFSIPSKLVYKRMMEVSDNFLAEQLLLLSAAQISNRYDTEKIIEHSLRLYMPDIPQKPIWVDGSGLSRYNLFTPQSFAYVLNKLYKEYPQEELFSMFAVGGKTGTLKSNYGGKTPYVYAKSGTLSNNYCLSGYIKTKSGKVLIFSVMNNHFLMDNWQVRQQTEKLLQYIRDNY